VRKAQGWGAVEAAEAHGLEAAKLAVETGKDDPITIARGGLAMAYLGSNHREGFAHVERALALNPNYALAMRFAGYISWYIGEHERSLPFLEQARRFSPVDLYARVSSRRYERQGSRMSEQRRLAAIVSADVAGCSRLMGRDESGTLAALKSLRQEVIDPAIGTHGGRIVKTTGDGLLLEFPSVVNAVRCAVEVQTAMADRTAGMAEDRRITFRIGINIGDIIVDGNDIFGDGVSAHEWRAKESRISRHPSRV
jgi:hypothetical protein